MRKTNLGASFDKFKEANPFPGNPMLLHVIQDDLRGLKGGDLLSLTVRDLALKNDLKGAMQLVLSCYTDNQRMAGEIFGAKLIADIVQYMAEKAEEENNPNDIPLSLFTKPGSKDENNTSY